MLTVLIYLKPKLIECDNRHSVNRRGLGEAKSTFDLFDINRENTTWWKKIS